MKCGIIYDNTSDLWPSLKNLQSTEDLVSKNYELFPFSALYGKQTTYYSFYRLAKKILQAKPTHLFFNSERPHPSVILSFLQQLDPHYCPQIGVRVFGNFQESFGEWLKHEVWLKKFSISFFSPSSAQTRLISQFLNDKTIIQTFPHPVKLMSFDLPLRGQTRLKYKVEQETVFLYSGRLSLQKNVSLIFNFIKELDSRNHVLLKSGFKILIAGPHDDKGAPALNINQREGLYYQELYQAFNQLPLHLKEHFLFLGNLPRQQLEAIYNASDFLVNFSLNHAEAYGVAIAEALSTGLPCILSAWGGHGDFIENFPQGCFPILPDLGKDGLKLNLDQKFFNQLPQSTSTTDQRKELDCAIRHYFKEYDLEHMLHSFLDLKTAPFAGFSSNLKEFLESRDDIDSYDSRSLAYQNTYQCYISLRGNTQ